jgi:hypothetical protein
VIRVGGGTVKGYERAALADAWARYLPPFPATSETSETSETHPAESSADVSLVSFVSQSGGDGGEVCAHCGGFGGDLLEASVAGEPLWLHDRCMDDYQPTERLATTEAIPRN